MRKEKSYKKALGKYIALIVVFLIISLALILEGYTLEISFCYILGVGVIIATIFLVSNLFKMKKRYEEMELNTKLIETRYKTNEEKLKTSNFIVSKHFSAFGLPYIEYRNDFNAKDNIHLWIDEENKRFAFCQLLENHFKIFSFSELLYTKILTNYTQVATRTQLTMLVVELKVKNDDFPYGIPVNDNQAYYTDSDNYTQVMNQADELKELLDNLCSKA